MIAILDYGVGNLHSIYKAIQNTGLSPVVTSNPKKLLQSKGLILPGVGAFSSAIKSLQKENLIDIIYKFVKTGKPLLGICLGLQLMFTQSQEGGNIKGLDFIKGKVKKIPTKNKLPHIGWNSINIIKKSSILENIKNKTFFYFAHSYYPVVSEENIIIANTFYNIEIPVIINKENIYATQFHPEKSSVAGLQFLNNWAKLC